MMSLAALYEADRERFPALAKLEKHGIAVGAYLWMIDGVYAALEGVEEHWGLEYDGDYRFRWVHSYWCAAAVVYYLYRFFEPLKSWPESVQKWFDADETETQNQLYLKSAEVYVAKQDAETWDYKNLRREMGAAVDELVRAVEPKEIKIEVAIENPHVTKSPQDTPPGNWGAHPANLNKNVENVDFKLTGADKREKIVTDDADVQVLADK